MLDDVQALAMKIRLSDTWVFEDLDKLCWYAGLSQEFRETVGSAGLLAGRRVALDAADILGVEIII